MNREIKFRGFCQQKNKWLYGMPITNEKNIAVGIKDRNELGIFNVIPETIGQFTGLHDKNGTEVYEGDIIDFTYNPQCLKEQFTGIVGLNRYNHSCIIVPNIPSKYSSNEFHIENAMNGEIIGNIFDNPELINN